MKTSDVPLLSDVLYTFELTNGHFVRINLIANANGQWAVEHLDSTGEFVAGLDIPAPQDDD